jgi:hypothetical protein
MSPSAPPRGHGSTIIAVVAKRANEISAAGGCGALPPLPHLLPCKTRKPSRPVSEDPKSKESHVRGAAAANRLICRPREPLRLPCGRRLKTAAHQPASGKVLICRCLCSVEQPLSEETSSCQPYTAQRIAPLFALRSDSQVVISAVAPADDEVQLASVGSPNAAYAVQRSSFVKAAVSWHVCSHCSFPFAAFRLMQAARHSPRESRGELPTPCPRGHVGIVESPFSSGNSRTVVAPRPLSSQVRVVLPLRHLNDASAGQSPLSASAGWRATNQSSLTAQSAETPITTCTVIRQTAGDGCYLCVPPARH